MFAIDVILTFNQNQRKNTQPALALLKSAMGTPEQCLKSVEITKKRHQNNVIDVIRVSLLLTLKKFHALF